MKPSEVPLPSLEQQLGLQQQLHLLLTARMAD
jgi:hypothetical protein